jgi:hypothetical protein
MNDIILFTESDHADMITFINDKTRKDVIDIKYQVVHDTHPDFFTGKMSEEDHKIWRDAQTLRTNYLFYLAD